MMELFKILLLWQLLPAAVSRHCRLQQLEDHQLQHHRQHMHRQQQQQHPRVLQQPTVLTGLWSWSSLNRQLWS